ncbi:hypothetical protein [Taylorella asinigenitalis]|uniref:hypothetical protein n=1 Tax=Taylorella asinigenitalis TaxID=84590 RepID=UPI00048CD6A2|nr:hypothetical protein [Taylorella asinigenitalis]
MLYALINNNIDDIVFLYPYYEALPPEAKEPIVQSWAGGLTTQFEPSKHFKNSMELASLIMSKLTTTMSEVPPFGIEIYTMRVSPQ